MITISRRSTIETHQLSGTVIARTALRRGSLSSRGLVVATCVLGVGAGASRAPGWLGVVRFGHLNGWIRGVAGLKHRHSLCGALLVFVVGAVVCATLWQPAGVAHSTQHAVPSLTAWGKIFSFLLLAALGVAYLVWRRPVVQARAILETSPLGTSPRLVTLVDWPLYVKTLLAVEALAMGGLICLRLTARPLTSTDSLGVAASAAIVAFVLHLLLLARRDDGGSGT